MQRRSSRKAQEPLQVVGAIAFQRAAKLQSLEGSMDRNQNPPNLLGLPVLFNQINGHVNHERNQDNSPPAGLEFGWDMELNLGQWGPQLAPEPLCYLPAAPPSKNRHKRSSKSVLLKNIHFWLIPLREHAQA